MSLFKNLVLLHLILLSFASSTFATETDPRRIVFLLPFEDGAARHGWASYYDHEEVKSKLGMEGFYLREKDKALFTVQIFTTVGMFSNFFSRKVFYGLRVTNIRSGVTSTYIDYNNYTLENNALGELLPPKILCCTRKPALPYGSPRTEHTQYIFSALLAKDFYKSFPF